MRIVLISTGAEFEVIEISDHYYICQCFPMLETALSLRKDLCRVVGDGEWEDVTGQCTIEDAGTLVRHNRPDFRPAIIHLEALGSYKMVKVKVNGWCDDAQERTQGYLLRILWRRT